MIDKVTINGKTFSFSIWNNEKISGNIITVDTETTVREFPEIPEIILMTVSNGVQNYLLYPHQIIPFFNIHAAEGSGVHWVFQNIAFDFWVLDKHFASQNVENPLYKIVDNNLAHDTLILDMIFRLARSDEYPDPRNLGVLAKNYTNLTVDKEDPYRMRYEEIKDKLFETVEPGFLTYAITDTIVTYYVFINLFKQCKEITKKAGTKSETIKKYGILTENIQIKSAITLSDISRRGIHIDLPYTNELYNTMKTEVDQLTEELATDPNTSDIFKRHPKTGSLLYTKNQMPKKSVKILREKLVKEANKIEEKYNIKVRIPQTAKGAVSCSVKEWKDYADKSPILMSISKLEELAKLCQFFYRLRKEIVYPRYVNMVRTGRTSSYDPNLQNVPKKKGMREIFEASEGFLLGAFDYKYLELRTISAVLMAMYGKTVLGEAIKAGKDPHLYTAAMFNGYTYEEFIKLKDTNEKFYKKTRQDAKICFSGDTEILTYTGWKRLDEYDGIEKVAQYVLPNNIDINKFIKWDGNNGTVDFVKPIAYKSFENELVYHQEDRNTDILCTSNHNILYLNTNMNTVQRAATDCTSVKYLIAGGKYTNNYKLTEIETRLLAMIVADGSFKSGEGIRLGFTKERKITRCRELLTQGEVTFSENIHNNGATSFYIPKNDPIRKLCLEYTDTDKNLYPHCLHDINGNVYLDEAVYWDGHIIKGTERKRTILSSINKQTQDIMQAWCALYGYTSVLKNGVITSSGNQSYDLSYRMEDIPRHRVSWKLQETNTRMKVYCVQVPSGYIIVRRNGKVCVLPNCNFGLLGGLMPESLVYYAKTVFNDKEINIEKATIFRNKWVNEVYPEMAMYLSEDTAGILAENLNCRVDEVWNAFDWSKERNTICFYPIKKIIEGNCTKKDGTAYNPNFVDRIWNKLNELCQNPSLKNRLVKREVGAELSHDLFWSKVETLTGRIRGKVSYTQTKNCVDAETEALTKRGWIRGFDLTKEDTFLTKNAKTGKLEWQKAIDVVWYPEYEGPLISFESKTFSALTTPDHRWLVDSKNNKNVCKTTDYISIYGDDSIHRTGDYEITKEVYGNKFIELCGWFLTDGNCKVTKRKTKEDYIQVSLFQSNRANPELVTKIRKLLIELNAFVSEKCETRTQLSRFLLKPKFSKILHKLFPKRQLTWEFLFKLSKKQAKLLMDTMIDGDGWRENNREKFCCKTKEQANTFQTLCLLAGYATNSVYRDMSKYDPTSAKLLNIPKATGCWYISILKRNRVQVTKNQKKEIISKQPIWCPIVPNTYFVARRNNTIYITGNTPFQGLAIDGAKLAMWRLLKEKYRVVGFVHDEFIIELHDLGGYVSLEECTKIQKILAEEMEKVTEGIPIETDFVVNKKWKKDGKIKIEGNRVYPV